MYSKKSFISRTVVAAAVALSMLGAVACGANKVDSQVEVAAESTTEVVAEVAENTEAVAEATEAVAEESTEAATEETVEETTEVASMTAAENIKGMYFSTTRNIEITEGETNADNYIKVNLRDEEAFNEEDITFVSTNPEVVSIAFDKKVSYYYLYFTLTGVADGEAEIYAVSNDGAVESEHKKVTVVPSKENVAKEDEVDKKG